MTAERRQEMIAAAKEQYRQACAMANQMYAGFPKDRMSAIKKAEKVLLGQLRTLAQQ